MSIRQIYVPVNQDQDHAGGCHVTCMRYKGRLRELGRCVDVGRGGWREREEEGTHPSTGHHKCKAKGDGKGDARCETLLCGEREGCLDELSATLQASQSNTNMHAEKEAEQTCCVHLVGSLTWSQSSANPLPPHMSSLVISVYTKSSELGYSCQL